MKGTNEEITKRGVDMKHRSEDNKMIEVNEKSRIEKRKETRK